MLFGSLAVWLLWSRTDIAYGYSYQLTNLQALRSVLVLTGPVVLFLVAEIAILTPPRRWTAPLTFAAIGVVAAVVAISLFAASLGELTDYRVHAEVATWLFAMGALVAFVAAAHSRSADSSDVPPAAPCPGCGYDLQGQRECRCPECGRTFTLGEFAKLQQ